MTDAIKTSHAPCEPLPQVLATRAGFLLNRLAGRIRQMTEHALAPLEIVPKHYGLMAVIKASGPTTQQSLCESLKIDRTSMVLLVDEAESKDLVVRNAHPTDRRCHLLSLSENGLKTFDQAHRLVERAEDAFFDTLNTEEKENFLTLLGKLFKNSDGPEDHKKKSTEAA